MSSPSDTMRLPIWWIAPPRAVALRDVAVVVEPDVSASPLKCLKSASLETVFGDGTAMSGMSVSDQG